MIDWPLFVLAMALTLVLLGAAASVLRHRLWSTAARTWRVVDVSHLELPPPPPIQPIAADLVALGFRRLGEAGQPELAARVGPAQIWYFVDKPGTSCAGVFSVGARSQMVVYSWFGDRAVIVTAYPHGDHIDAPDFRFHTISSSAVDAYRHHQEQLPDFAARYGPPSRLVEMQEVLRLDALYNRTFAQRRDRPFLLRELRIPLFQLYLIAVALALFAALQVFHLPLGPVLLGAVALVTPAIVVLVATRRRQRGPQRGG